MARLRRLGPALLLLVLAPIVAEFLLGDFSVRSLWLLPLFLLQYGGGALLVREVARRSGRGWPAMVLLALAYALVEEAFTTQSLFNPSYLGQRLLDSGYLPLLGTSPVWAVFVLTIHVVWSISTPILIAEEVAGPRRVVPWLGRPGLPLVVVLYALGCLLTALGTLAQSRFVAPAPQLAGAAALTVAVVAAAFLLPVRRARPPRPAPAPAPWLVAVATLALTTAFELAHRGGEALALPPAVVVAAMLACAAAGVALITAWSRARGWGSSHRLALATGAVLTYAWVGLNAFRQGRTNIGWPAGPIDIAGQVRLILAVLGLIAWATARSRPRSATPDAATGA